MNDRNAKRTAETMPVLAGLKYDGGKLPWELLPEDALEQVVRVLQFGAQKYAPRNWEKGIAYTRVYGAIRRHLVAWLKGEELDPETGISHLAHAACEILFALTFETRGMKECDDRPVTVNAAARANAGLLENVVHTDEIDADPSDPPADLMAMVPTRGIAQASLPVEPDSTVGRTYFPERMSPSKFERAAARFGRPRVTSMTGTPPRKTDDPVDALLDLVMGLGAPRPKKATPESVSLNTLQALLAPRSERELVEAMRAMGAPEDTIKELEDAIENGCGDPACTACKDKPNNRGVIPRGVTRH
jgi:hypothetical protein